MSKIIDYTLVEKLYDPTLSDGDNAENMGISKTSFLQWRKSKNYLSVKRRGEKGKIKRDKFDKLYSMGYVDREIASKLGVKPLVICLYRKRHGIPPNRTHVPYMTYTQLEKEVLPNLQDSEKPWKDPESLFCDGKFLEQFKKGVFEERAQ